MVPSGPIGRSTSVRPLNLTRSRRLRKLANGKCSGSRFRLDRSCRIVRNCRTRDAPSCRRGKTNERSREAADSGERLEESAFRDQPSAFGFESKVMAERGLHQSATREQTDGCPLLDVLTWFLSSRPRLFLRMSAPGRVDRDCPLGIPGRLPPWNAADSGPTIRGGVCSDCSGCGSVAEEARSDRTLNQRMHARRRKRPG